MSTLNVANITDGTNSVETVYVARGSAKAWVNFNGTGTIATRDSFNLSSLTDNGVGDYTVNFTSAFAAADYSVSGSARQAGAGGESTTTNAQAASNVGLIISYYTSAYDPTAACISIHGDLA